jgi:multidrug resistance efflux pump
MAFAEADATYKKAQADLLAAEEVLGDSELHAPFDAVILDRRVQPSQTVVNQLRVEPMLVLASSREMLVRFVIQADEIGELATGKKVNVKCRGKTYQGVVEALRLDTSTGFGSSASSGYSVEIIFPTEEQLLPGTAASVSLP